MNLRKIYYLSVCAMLLTVGFIGQTSAQGRARVVKQTSSQPINAPQPVDQNRRTVTLPTSNPASRPVLTNNIIVVGSNQPAQPAKPLVTKTSSSKAVNAPANVSSNTSANAFLSRSHYSSSVSLKMFSAIQDLYGIPYLYGSAGPNRYDCSGFVWAVFQRAGINFTRTSARTFWNEFEPVEGADRFKFGTLVFFNKLGHVGIVADENGFYQASSSKGITYSKFAGYWEKRIVGYRRVPMGYYAE